MTSFVLEALTSDCWTAELRSVVSQLTAREGLDLDFDLAAWKLDVRSVLRQTISARHQEDQTENVMAIDSSYGAMPHSLAEVLVNAVLMIVFSLLGGLGTLLWRRLSGSSPRRDKMARAAAEIEAILAEM